MTTTLATIEAVSGITAYDWLARDIEVPVLDGIQAQGDLLVIPIQATPGAGTVTVDRKGVDLVVGVDGGHTHSLVAPDGGCTVKLRDTTVGGSPADLTVALLECVNPVYLMHPEHGASGVAR